MAVDPGFLAFVEDRLEEILPVRTRRMFGGAGVYTEGLFFALVDDDVLYLKADDESRGHFEAAGCRPFRPYGPEGAAMSYYQIPGDALEDVDELRPWVERAVEAAERARG